MPMPWDEPATWFCPTCPDPLEHVHNEEVRPVSSTGGEVRIRDEAVVKDLDGREIYRGEVRSVSSSGGEKGVKLARYDLIPVGPLRQVAEHYGKGAAKYADHNWRRGYEWSKSYAALMRHATQFWGGEDVDEETGSHHMAAVAFHALALLEYAEAHPDFDDRYRQPEPLAEWERELLYGEAFPSRVSDPADE